MHHNLLKSIVGLFVSGLTEIHIHSVHQWVSPSVRQTCTTLRENKATACLSRCWHLLEKQLLPELLEVQFGKPIKLGRLSHNLRRVFLHISNGAGILPSKVSSNKNDAFQCISMHSNAFPSLKIKYEHNRNSWATVDGRNPAPPGMYKTLKRMG